MSIALGNKKPQRLLEVEKLIWHALFTLLEGATAPEDVLADLLVQIPWQTLQPPLLAISKQESEWFTIDAIPVSASPAQKIIPVPSTLLTSTSLPPRQGHLPTTTPPPDDNAMDQSVDHQQESASLNLTQSMEPDNSAPGDPTTSSLPANNAMDETVDFPATFEAQSSELAQGFTATDGAGENEEDDNEEDGNRTQGLLSMSESDKSLEAPTSRRSIRLALEKSKDDSLRNAPESSLCSTSPLEPPKTKHQATTGVKRKAPTGDAGVKDLLSTEGSSASPIDVDALEAVLQRYPLKREPQVSRR